MKHSALMLMTATLLGCGGGSGSSDSPDPVVNRAPVISNLTVNDRNGGAIRHGDVVIAEYSYQDADGDAQGMSQLRWFIDGTVVSVGPTYIPRFEHAGKEVTLIAQAVAQTGVTQGNEIKLDVGTVLENETLIFFQRRSGVDDLNTLSIYATKGTPDETIKLAKAQSVGNPVQLGERWLIPNVLNLEEVDVKDVVTGFLLTDGTLAGTSRVIVNSAPDLFPANLHEFNGKVLFRGYDTIHGNELWITDGTAEGTRFVKDLRDEFGGEDSNPEQFVTVGNAVYFRARLDNDHTILWKTDGTADGTQPVQPTVYNPTQLTAYKDKLVFSGTLLENVSSLAVYPMALDTSSGSVYGLGGPQPHPPRASFYLHPDFLLCSALVTPFDNRLFTSQGERNDLTLIETPAVGFGSIYSTSLGLFGMSGTSDGYPERLLWRIESKDQISALSLNGSERYFVSALAEINDKVVVSASDSEGDRELYRISGSELLLIKDINPEKSSMSSRYMKRVNDVLLFVAEDPEHGKELWQTQGDEASTQLFLDLTAGHNGFTIYFDAREFGAD